MDIVFVEHDDNDKFRDVRLRNKFSSVINSLESRLLAVYTELNESVLSAARISIMDATSVIDCTCCTRNKNNKNLFFIKMVFSSSNDAVEMLIHKLCHVMQYLSGQLDAGSSESELTWKGEKFILSDIEPHRMPWERDAILNALTLHKYYMASSSST
ncbi:hypothetical protein D9M71_324200 [compost metagenome]